MQAHKFFIDKRPHKGMTNAEYLLFMQSDIDEKSSLEMDENEKQLFEFTKLNLTRSLRISKSYNPSENIIKTINKITSPQLWMVLTEAWCGDSAQTLPYIAKWSELNPKIDLRILLRDDNLDIMDLYLTNGTARSIPKLVAFTQEGKELFTWGPRPSEAQHLVNKLKAEGKSKEEFQKELHLWYSRNKGKALEDEFIELINNSMKAGY